MRDELPPVGERVAFMEERLDRYEAALERIAHGPNSAPTLVEPWSRAEALIALRRYR